jgi:lipopolysaccharide export system permease protein
MTILTRYVIRAHVGPFLFAFIAVTGLLFLNAIAQRLEMLAGRGLGTEVILEFVLLSLPHVVALTFPMAVLVAVLYTFSDLTGRNEIMALAAGGIRSSRLLLPLLVVGAALSSLMFWFNAQVLPESNHRLLRLMTDIGSTNPTLELREEVVNEISTEDGLRFFLRASRIDPGTNTLAQVEITDMSRIGEHRVILAERAEMAFTPDRTDLYLTLQRGTTYEVTDDRRGAFQRRDFEEQVLPMRGVGSELERRTGSGTRGPREMTIPQLHVALVEQHEILQTLSEESRHAALNMVHSGLGMPALPPSAGGMMMEDGQIEEARAAQQVREARRRIHQENIYRYEVEVHKKYAIAFACLLFVLLGAPVATRFPQGGVGMVIATSVGIFFLYWMGLIGGERIAERGRMEPWLAMWLPNMILAVPATWLAFRMGIRLPSTRGSGGFRALVERLTPTRRKLEDAA